ncbi:SMI1/KNR4 family protein [Deinococcus sp. YIM 134068]|uniref:SMI1/KNR4 family protein n=1 Tax=Deinococcus lichenicola TaxID=3118910 RepID=UPI002F94B877
MKDDLPTILARLDAWLAAHVPAIHATLRPGASDAELDALASRTGLELPEGFRTLYRWHDGQERAGTGFALGLEFLPLEGVGREWEMWRKIGETSPELNDETPSTSRPPGAIWDAYTTPGWLGFLADGSGNSVGLDFNPGPAGMVGQVITFGSDEETKYVLADTLHGFLAQYLERLESGDATVKRLEGFDPERWSVELHEGGFSRGGTAGLYPGFGPGWERRRRKRR